MRPVYFMGLGYERGADPTQARALAAQCCTLAGIAAGDIRILASLDIKVDDGLLPDLARDFGGTVRYFSASALEAETSRLLNPSDAVFRAVGCHGVAEAAALAAAGPTAKLIVPKTSAHGITCAIARRDGLEDKGI